MPVGRTNVGLGFAATARPARRTMNDDQELSLAEIKDDYPHVYREAAEKFVALLYYVIARMPDSVEKWGIAFATSNPICNGRSMSEIAAKHGWSRAAISYEARKCCEANGLPPSSYMKSEQAVVTSKHARIKVVKAMDEKRKK
jgi:hypothetical protein